MYTKKQHQMDSTGCIYIYICLRMYTCVYITLIIKEEVMKLRGSEWMDTKIVGEEKVGWKWCKYSMKILKK